jgi:hypothetical protein
MFGAYFEIGWQHIIDIKAFDHLLFIAVLAAGYSLAAWRQILVLVTAFTIGHCITLALSTLHLISLPVKWIEFLVPFTIAITALANVFYPPSPAQKMPVNYWLALFFGLIHGMAFANGLLSLLGRNAAVFLPLLGFNLGVEAGQLVVVCSLLILAFLFQLLPNLKKQYWVWFVSGTAFVAAIFMTVERIPF